MKAIEIVEQPHLTQRPAMRWPTGCSLLRWGHRVGSTPRSRSSTRRCGSIPRIETLVTASPGRSR